jgi:hypothetical protein
MGEIRASSASVIASRLARSCCMKRIMCYANIRLIMLIWYIMIMTATNPYGQDYRPRKKSAMIMQGLIVGGIVWLALIALAAGLHYGTEGHSAPPGHTSSGKHSP